MAIQKTNGLLVDDKVLAVKYATHDRSMLSMRRPQANKKPLTQTEVKVQTHLLATNHLQRLNSDFSFNSIRSALKDIGLDQVVVRRERQGCNLDFQIPGGAPIKYPEDQGLV
ncbi:hypothetical protein ACSBR1_016496 [Camellia fascicularis]